MAVSSGGVLLVGLDRIILPARARVQERDAFSGGQELGLVDFIHEPSVEMDRAQGTELDGRLYTDLSGVSLNDGVTPTEKFYIRTRVSEFLPEAKMWRVRIDGLLNRPQSRTIEELRRAAKPQGLHLMECAGNVPLVHFGLISVASWAGVPLAEILDNSGIASKPRTARVLITGFDRYATKSRTSVPGASWIFSLEELKAARAFLATEMNDEPLTVDHGAPIRLVVPGWYGCTCIKWVERITFVEDAAEATSQMQEYAARTHQRGLPALARDYQPAVIDPAAMPIRVEKWLVEGKIKYRVAGIAWGGSAPIKKLLIRFNPEEDYAPVDRFAQAKSDPWTFWTHAWSPKEPGTYSIRLAVGDPGVRTRRLDSGYYVRTVEVSEL
ncbi:MAG TPA: molybdopterin-dependent oxidoreductase [Candidatus Cybelea sp.]|nr:molybdopterin-dependent oxidoreductase [Candidatus Cybelea sp.]